MSLLAIAFCACNETKNNSSSNEEKSDSIEMLTRENEQLRNETDDLLSTLNEIEEGFRQISEAENRVAVAQQGEGANSKQRIRENIQFIQTTMKQNKELINKLKQQLRESSVKSDALRKLVENMSKQLEENEKQMLAMREQLDEKDVHIMELDEQVANLNTDVKELTTETNQRAETISIQDKQLNTAWFVFGTKDELKEQQILVDGKVLQSSFNKEYFTKIDIRVDKEVKLYSSSAKILTSHPSSAYTLQRDANKQYVLRITDPQLFWSTSKYLVVLVK